MNPDTPFRTIVVVGFLLFLSIMLYHRIRSWASRERLDRSQEGVFILATLRPVGLLLWLGVIAYLIHPPWMAWASLALPRWLRWTGVGVFLLGLGLLAWALGNLGKNLTDTVVTRREHTLVTEGPYHWVRHPFYDSAALLILAISIIAANWFFLLAGSVVLLLLVVRTQKEEERLLARFGEPYREYTSRTGRFVPRLASRKRPRP